MNYNHIAKTLDSAALNSNATSQLAENHGMNLDQAYAIQSISLSRRYRRGEKWVGLKLGFTSKAKMEQMGVHDMIWGRLTDKMKVESNGHLQLNKFIHPRAEPEIAFLVSKDITETVTLANAHEYISKVAVAIEIIDSRYENFKFSLEDVVADNCSSAGFIIGDWLPGETTIQDLGIQLIVDGAIAQEGNSNAILGNPLESFVAAARLANENGELLVKDSIILAGAATPAVYIKAGQKIEAKAEGLGSVYVNVD